MEDSNAGQNQPRQTRRQLLSQENRTALCKAALVARALGEILAHVSFSCRKTADSPICPSDARPMSGGGKPYSWETPSTESTWPVYTVTDFSLPETGPPLPLIAHTDHRDLATDRNLDKTPNACNLRSTAMHLGQLDLTLGFKKLPPLQKLFSAARSSQVAKMPIQSQTSARSFYVRFNKLCRPSIRCIPGRAIPVNEVYNWQK